MKFDVVSFKLFSKKQVVRETDAVPETRSHLVRWSKYKQEVEESGRSMFWNSDGDNKHEDEIIRFDFVCSSSWHDFLLDERKKDSMVQRLSESIFRV